MSNLLRETRNEKHLSMVELSTRARVSYSHLSRIECGWQAPGLATAGRLAKALETSVERLFPNLHNSNEGDAR